MSEKIVQLNEEIIKGQIYNYANNLVFLAQLFNGQIICFFCSFFKNIYILSSTAKVLTGNPSQVMFGIPGTALL